MDQNQQEKFTLDEMLDTQRWLINNGLVPDSVKNQLFFYGSIVHTEVQAVEVKIQPEVKTVYYIVYIKKDLLQKLELYKKLSTATSLFGLWQFKRLLKKEGNLDWHSILNSFVRDFCGRAWQVKLTVADFDVYVDTIGVEDGAGGPSQQPDFPSN